MPISRILSNPQDSCGGSGKRSMKRGLMEQIINPHKMQRFSE
jgi:hypothetical protein